MEQKESLKVLGRVSKEITAKLFPGREFTKENAEWFFVSYAPESFPLNSTFDIYTDFRSHQSSRNNYVSIKLRRVVDQFGKELDEIPQGYKTICRLEFSSHIPTVFRNLPVRKDWNSNPESIYLLQLKNIFISHNNSLTFAYQLLAASVYAKLLEQRLDHFSAHDIADILSVNYAHEKTNVWGIVRCMVMEGKAKTAHEDEDKMVLVKK
jgi:hypothetical protein